MAASSATPAKAATTAEAESAGRPTAAVRETLRDPSSDDSSATQPFDGRIVIVGVGCIARGVLPLLQRHLALRTQQVLIVSPPGPALDEVALYGWPVLPRAVGRDNAQALLGPHLQVGDLLLNLSVGVDSVPLVALARERGALYVDTALEPWADEAPQEPQRRSNHARREAVLALGRKPGSPTAVICHGANPGLVSHFVKAALLHLRDHATLEPLRRSMGPQTAGDWAALAQQLGVRTIHIAERDTQRGTRPRAADEFVNTWSVRGFVEEALQPAELGWGTHERHFPADGRRHPGGSPAAIWLQRPGAGTRVHTWTPQLGPTLGLLITHMESISIAEHLTLGPSRAPHFRPTVHYAYRPCDDALLSLHEMQGRAWQPLPRRREMRGEISEGVDELGVLIGGPEGGALWWGSQLSDAQARAACPDNSATTLQVTSGVMAAVVWALRHPDRGLLEPDELPHEAILSLARPYLGRLGAVRTEWTPLAGRTQMPFGDTLDLSDPWQFLNVRAP